MDFDTARQVLLQQTIAPATDESTSFIHCLQQRQPPIPGQVTSLLLALKVLQSNLQGEPTLSRDLAYALFLVAYESRRLYEAGRQAGVEWPPLLDEDLQRIGAAAKAILADGVVSAQP